MNYQQRLAISYYKTIAVLNEPHKIFIAQHQETNKIYIKKILQVYNLQIFQYLKAHPVEGLPMIIDFYEDEENHELILIEEYISGDTLQSLIEERRLNITSILHYTHELCKILDTIHSAQPPIIHRDLKPSNIIVNSNDHLVLLDFNAAKNYKAGSQSDTVLLGTQGYAAPEQYGFGASSPQTDIYALGIVLKEMLDSLEAPASTSEAILRNSFQEVIQRCTQFKPEDRFQSAMEVVRHLHTFQTQKPKAPSTPDFNQVHKETVHTYQRQRTDSRQVHQEKVYKEKRSTPGNEQASLRQYLLPGFRTFKPWKMALAALGYSFLIYLGATMNSENPLFNSQRMDAIWVALCLFAGVLVGGNYLNLRDHLPLCNFRHPIPRYLGITFMTICIPLLLVTVGIVLSMILFGTP